VEDVANKIAKSKGLDLVLFYTDAVTEADYYNPNNLQRKLSQSGALMPIIVAPGMDITDTVIEALDFASAPPEGPRPCYPPGWEKLTSPERQGCPGAPGLCDHLSDRA